jgi:hypothetical protein
MANNPLPRLFRAIDVWQRRNDIELVRYRCFQSLSDGKFSVQREDRYQLPLDQRQVAALDGQYLRLLSDQPPEERSGAYDTLPEAIAAHLEAFTD